MSDDHERYPLRVGGYAHTSWVHEAPVTAEQLLAEMAGAGVDRAVLVQAGGAYQTDNSYLADAHAAHADVFGSVAIIDMTSADPVAELVRWVERGVQGVRLFAVVGREPWFDDGTADALLAAASDRGIRVCAAVLPEVLPDLGALLERNPSVTLSLDHCGFDPVAALDYAGLDNLWLKVTTHLLDTVDDPAGTVDALATAFGIERMMWGSDYSQTHDRPYPELLGAARTAIAHRSPGDQERFLGGTALELWPELAG